MTWKELKEKVEAEGVKDDDLVWYIDVSSYDTVQVESHINGWKISGTY